MHDQSCWAAGPAEQGEMGLAMYPEFFVAPMREELTRLGIEELRSAEAVDQALTAPGTTMVVVNSVCGCAAGKARPGIAMAMAATGPPCMFFKPPMLMAAEMPIT